MQTSQHTEADAIAAFFANGGEVKKCPTGKSALATEYVWEEGKGLVVKDPEAAAAARRSFGKRAQSRKPDRRQESPEVAELRRRLVLLMADGHGAAYCAKALNRDETTIRKHAKAIGATFERAKRVASEPRRKALPAPKPVGKTTLIRLAAAARREKIGELLDAGKMPGEIAAILDEKPRTVHSDIHAMGRTKPIAPAKREQVRDAIRAAYNPNRSTLDIAAITGFAGSTVRRHLADMGLTPRRNYGGHPAEQVESIREKVLSMVADGKGGREIADTLNIRISAVHDYCRKARVSIPRGRRKPPPPERKAELALAAAVRALKAAGMSADDAAAAIKEAA